MFTFTYSRNINTVGKKLSKTYQSHHNELQIPVRSIVGVVVCLASMIYMIVQSNMSIIILAMTKPIHNTAEEPPNYGPRYDWSAYDQSLVIGSFFWGSMIITLIVGVTVERYGTRYICGLALIAATLITSLTPVSAQIFWLTIVLRFLSGIGTIYPSLQALIANWAAPEEKGIFLSALLFNGIGAIIDWSMSGIIIERFGWFYAFYAVVIILAIFSIVWFFIIYDSPRKHPYISQAEMDYIESKLTRKTRKTKQWPPFRLILRSITFWAWVLLHFGASWGIFFIVTAAPRYLSEVHMFTITATGLIGSLPTFMRCIGGVSFRLLAHIIPGCLLISLTFFGDRPYICVAFITLAMCSSGSTTITTLQVPHDIAPNFAVTIYSIGGLFSVTPGFIAPLVVAYFTKERSSQDEWQIFFIGAGIYIGTAIIFILFGSGNVQKYNDVMDTEDVEDKNCESYRLHEKLSQNKD